MVAVASVLEAISIVDMLDIELLGCGRWDGVCDFSGKSERASLLLDSTLKEAPVLANGLYYMSSLNNCYSNSPLKEVLAVSTLLGMSRFCLESDANWLDCSVFNSGCPSSFLTGRSLAYRIHRPGTGGLGRRADFPTTFRMVWGLLQRLLLQFTVVHLFEIYP